MTWGRGYPGISFVFTWQFPEPSIMCYSQYSLAPSAFVFTRKLSMKVDLPQWLSPTMGGGVCPGSVTAGCEHSHWHDHRQGTDNQ